MGTDRTLTQIDEYYKLNLQHLSWSFWSSIFALFAGLMALLIGICLVIYGNFDLTSQLSVIGGILTQFIGAGFFFLYSRNLKQLNVFYEKLIKHHDTLYAVSLANQVPDSEKSSAVLAVIGNLLSRGEPPISTEVLKAVIENKSPKNGA